MSGTISVSPNMNSGPVGTFPDGHMVKFVYQQVNPTIQLIDANDVNYYDVNGTSIDYTPATGASYVVYRTCFAARTAAARSIFHMSVTLDGTVENTTRQTVDTAGSASYFQPQPMIINHVMTAWTGSKTVKVRCRDYDSAGNYAVRFHEINFWEGSGWGGQFQCETLIYSVM